MHDSKGAKARWEGHVEGLRLYSSYQEAVGIDGEAIEFEWNIFPGFSSLSLLQEIQKDLDRKNLQLEEFKDRIIFMSMFNDIDRSKRNCISNAGESLVLRDEILARTLDVAGSWVGRRLVWKFFLRSKRRAGFLSSKKMVQRFKEICHPVFKSISALSRGILKRKKVKETMHFNGDSTNTELLFQTIHSVSQLSIYGAEANWCQQFGLTGEEKGRANLSVDKRMLTCIHTT